MSLHPYQQDDALLRAWQQGIAEGSNSSQDIPQQFKWREPESLPQFTRHYQQLTALSRQVRRRLQRQWRRSLAGIAMLLALGMQPALAATINVGGTCTLARAIRSANSDTAVSGCTAGSGADRVVLPACSTQTLTTVNNTVYGATGLPVIRSVITIDGNGSPIRRASSAPAFRIITVGSHGNLTLHDTTIRGGKLSTDDRGGGVFNRGRLIITNCTVSGNFSNGGGGGGGVANDSYSTTTLVNSIISGNSTSGIGASGGGIGIFGHATITNCTVYGNSLLGSRARGGGVYNDRSGRLNLNRTLISGNTARDAGSELYNYSDRFGTGSVIAANFNLFGHSGLTNARAFRNFTRVTDITATSNGNKPTRLSRILNTTLANHGGPTKTHSLVAGSPAIDAVNNGTCLPPARDQRGKARPQDGDGDGGIACDIGAFERGPPHL